MRGLVAQTLNVRAVGLGEDWMRAHEVTAEDVVGLVEEARHPAEQQVVHLKHRRLQKEFEFVDVEQVAVSLLDVQVRVEEVLGAKHAFLSRELFGMYHDWVVLGRDNVNVVVHLEVVKPQLQVLVLLSLYL